MFKTNSRVTLKKLLFSKFEIGITSAIFFAYIAYICYRIILFGHVPIIYLFIFLPIISLLGFQVIFFQLNGEGFFTGWFKKLVGK